MGSSEAALPKDTWSLRGGRVLVRGTVWWPAVGAALQKPEQEASTFRALSICVVCTHAECAHWVCRNAQGTQVPEQLTYVDHQLFGAD